MASIFDRPEGGDITTYVNYQAGSEQRAVEVKSQQASAGLQVQETSGMWSGQNADKGNTGNPGLRSSS